MDKLPVEILIQIAELIPRKRGRGKNARLARPGLAALSRGWQYAIERLTFSSLVLASNQLDIFFTIFSEERGVHRSQFLQRLDYHIVLDPHDYNFSSRLETDSDRAATDKAASLVVSGLLHVLSQWSANHELNLTLDLFPKDPDDRRYDYSYIKLSGIDDVRAPCVHTLSHFSGERNFDLASQVKLTAALPGLVLFTWTDQENQLFLSLRRQLRNDFASALEGFQLSPEAKSLELKMSSDAYFRSKQVEAMIALEAQPDSVCENLRKVIGKGSLESLKIEAQIDKALFWAEVPEGNLPWANMVNLDISFERITPSGKYYFTTTQGPAVKLPPPKLASGFFAPGYGTESESKAALAYRRWLDGERIIGGKAPKMLVNEEVMIPMLEAYARVLSQMPCLTRANLSASRDHREDHWFINYWVPPAPIQKHENWPEFDKSKKKNNRRNNNRRNNKNDNKNGNNSNTNNKKNNDKKKNDLDDDRAYFTFTVGSWRVKHDLLQLFRNVGKETHGREPLIKFRK